MKNTGLAVAAAAAFLLTGCPNKSSVPVPPADSGVIVQPESSGREGDLKGCNQCKSHRRQAAREKKAGKKEKDAKAQTNRNDKLNDAW